MPKLIWPVATGEGDKYQDLVPGVDTVAEGGSNALLAAEPRGSGWCWWRWRC